MNDESENKQIYCFNGKKIKKKTDYFVFDALVFERFVMQTQNKESKKTINSGMVTTAIEKILKDDFVKKAKIIGLIKYPTNFFRKTYRLLNCKYGWIICERSCCRIPKLYNEDCRVMPCINGKLSSIMTHDTKPDISANDIIKLEYRNQFNKIISTLKRVSKGKTNSAKVEDSANRSVHETEETVTDMKTKRR